VIDLVLDEQEDGLMTQQTGIGVDRGCSGCTCTPRAVKKISGVIYRENV